MKHLSPTSICRVLAISGALLLTLVLITPAHLSAQPQSDDASQQTDLSRRRRVLLLQERLRLLYSQGQYEEVVDEARTLLQIDPGDKTAYLLKDLAEQRLAAGDTEPPSQPGNISSLPPGITLEDTGYQEILDRAPTPAPRPTDAAAPGTEPGEQAAAETDGPKKVDLMTALYGESRGQERAKPFNMVLFFSTLAGLIAVITLAGGGIVWMRAKDLAPAETAATAASVGRAMPLEDMPTAQHGSQAAQSEMPTQPGQYEEQEPMHDMVTRPDIAASSPEEEEEEEQQPEPALNTEQMDALASETIDAPIQIDKAPQEPREEKEGVGSMGIDYSGTDDALFSQSQALDVTATQSSPFDEAPEERVDDGQPDTSDSVQLDLEEFESQSKQQEPEQQATTGDAFAPDIAPPATEPASGIALGQEEEKEQPASSEETAFDDDVLDIAPPAGAPGSAGQEKSYNSLMFGMEDEQQPATQDEKEPVEELTTGSFNEQFSDVMFGAGAEETRIPGEKEEKEEDADEMDQTVRIEPPASGGEASGTPKPSMFERQRDAGKQALDAKDYARAVQCLSVAASLKPGDKDVRTLLEEARQKRRSG